MSISVRANVRPHTLAPPTTATIKYTASGRCGNSGSLLLVGSRGGIGLASRSGRGSGSASGGGVDGDGVGSDANACLLVSSCLWPSDGRRAWWTALGSCWSAVAAFQVGRTTVSTGLEDGFVAFLPSALRRALVQRLSSTTIIRPTLLVCDNMFDAALDCECGVLAVFGVLRDTTIYGPESSWIYIYIVFFL